MFVPGPGQSATPPPVTSDRPLDPAIEPDGARRDAERTAALLEDLEQASRGRLRIARSAADLADAVGGDHLAAVLHLEGAEPLDRDLNTLDNWYGRGLRSLGIVWSRPNAFAQGVPFRSPSSPDTGPGLTPAGKELVRRCNRLGILIDLSHLNERGFWDVARLSDAPLVASHSNAHAVHPASRNLTDEQLDAIAASHGLVGATVHTGMLGRPDARIDDFVRHVDHLVERMGIDHVGFGSDFDGAPLPADVPDVAALPRVLEALRSAGYDEPSLRKIANENWLRVLAETWGE